MEATLRESRAASVSERSDGVILDQVLIPYKRTKTDYLKTGGELSIDVDSDDLYRMRGEFEIPHSCYIDSTGHFNAVEFVICYNQLAYFAFGKLIASGVLKTLPIQRKTDQVKDMIDDLTYESYLQKQLASMFIVKSDLKFKAPIDASQFYADLSIQKIMFRTGVFFIKTGCRFYDDGGGGADGEITLAYAPQGLQ